MDRSEKRRRLKDWKAKQRADARSRLPLPDDDMRALFDRLSRALSQRRCDHSSDLTRSWLHEHGHPVERVFGWLEETGGYCDCEILNNSEGAWLETIDHRTGGPEA